MVSNDKKYNQNFLIKKLTKIFIDGNAFQSLQNNIENEHGIIDGWFMGNAYVVTIGNKSIRLLGPYDTRVWEKLSVCYQPESHLCMTTTNSGVFDPTWLLFSGIDEDDNGFVQSAVSEFKQSKIDQIIPNFFDEFTQSSAVDIKNFADQFNLIPAVDHSKLDLSNYNPFEIRQLKEKFCVFEENDACTHYGRFIPMDMYQYIGNMINASQMDENDEESVMRFLHQCDIEATVSRASMWSCWHLLQ